MSSMRAAIYESFGPAAEVLKVVEIERPEPGPGEVRVRVRVSAVNPTDWKSRNAGQGELPFPFLVPNQDGAGEIDAVGEGVSEDRVGERVWLYFAAYKRQYGTAAQWICLPQEQAVALPADAGFDLGASLGIPALTAHRCLFADGPLDGLTVLVAGGAGAVGHYAIELARRAGARVISTVSSDEKAALARAAGAHETVNYREGDPAEAILALAPGGVDRVVEVAPARTRTERGGHRALRLGGGLRLRGRPGGAAPPADDEEREPALHAGLRDPARRPAPGGRRSERGRSPPATSASFPRTASPSTRSPPPTMRSRRTPWARCSSTSTDTV